MHVEVPRMFSIDSLALFASSLRHGLDFDNLTERFALCTFSFDRLNIQ
jgi:hypothetical protein